MNQEVEKKINKKNKASTLPRSTQYILKSFHLPVRKIKGPDKMDRAMRKRVFGQLQTAKVQISLIRAFPLTALPLTEALDTTEYCMNGEQRPG